MKNRTDKQGVKAARLYLHAVRKKLPMRFREKRQVMKRLALRVVEYTYANPAAGYPELQDLFGAPEEVSAVYVESRDSRELAAALNLRQRIWMLVVSAAATLVLLTALVGGYVVWHTHNAAPRYVVITIPPEDGSVMNADAPPPDLNMILAQT